MGEGVQGESCSKEVLEGSLREILWLLERKQMLASQISFPPINQGKGIGYISCIEVLQDGSNIVRVGVYRL